MALIGSKSVGMAGTLQTGRSGLAAAQAGIANSGHNIANANTEGFSRQRISQTAEIDRGTGLSRVSPGAGARISSVERVNDRFVEKQIRNANRDLAYAEEKGVILQQVEDVFNEMGGEGLNRLMSRFFNEFRKLSNEPESEAIRQSVREASLAVVRDLKRLRGQVDQIMAHADARLEGYVREVQGLADEIANLNTTIQTLENSGGASNDLMDQRDLALKKLGSLVDVAMYTDTFGGYIVDIKGFGPLVVTGRAERLSTERTDANESGKHANRMDVFLTNSSSTPITDRLSGGRIGALIEARDKTLSGAASKLDDIAFELARAVNEVHRQGFTSNGGTQVDFFKEPVHRQGAAGVLALSDAVMESPHSIAAAAAPDSPGDNRIALALSNLQGLRMMSEGRSTVDDFYNSIVSEVGVVANQNKTLFNQSKDVAAQLGKIREEISGVSIDEETTKLMQYQHAFDASARVIRVADEMMKTVLSLKD
jgi:flagellar hook-associated protein 1 FlgK